jgi:hypothetical protein
MNKKFEEINKKIRHLVGLLQGELQVLRKRLEDAFVDVAAHGLQLQVAGNGQNPRFFSLRDFTLVYFPRGQNAFKPKSCSTYSPAS